MCHNLTNKVIPFYSILFFYSYLLSIFEEGTGRGRTRLDWTDRTGQDSTGRTRQDGQDRKGQEQRKVERGEEKEGR